MKKPTKYIYLHVLQGQYGHGWEDLTASESRREVVAAAPAARRLACSGTVVRGEHRLRVCPAVKLHPGGRLGGSIRADPATIPAQTG